MKRLLAILLTLVLCIGVFVSCDNNEETSSSEHETAATPVTQNDATVDYKSSFPVFEHTIDSYESNRIISKEDLNYELFDRWVIDDYESFLGFISENTNYTNVTNITESAFEDSFIIAVFRNDDYYKTENYCYGNFKKKDDYFVICFEYTKYYGKAYDEAERPYSFDLILVPREACNEDVNNISVCIQTIVHEYDCSGELIE